MMSRIGAFTKLSMLLHRAGTAVRSLQLRASDAKTQKPHLIPNIPALSASILSCRWGLYTILAYILLLNHLTGLAILDDDVDASLGGGGALSALSLYAIHTD